MENHPISSSNLPPDQEAIRAKCFHPTGTFIKFKKEEIEQSIPECFEKIVRMYPDQIAVKTRNHVLTYEELNKAANRMARAIQDKHRGKIEPIILLSEHGPGAIIACLGILKAGKILVAVDLSFPLDRIAYVLDDCGAAVILTDNQSLSLATALTKTKHQIINIDGLGSNLCDENIGLQLSPAAAAQIIYSSGSTGRPKGIVRSHRRLLHSTMLLVNATHICSDDRLLLLRHLSFGAGITEILKGLLSGAALFPFDIKQNGLSRLADLLIREEITYYTSTPSTFRYFITELNGKEQFSSIRTIRLGGEPLSSREVESYKRHFPQNCILMNQLSATEAGTLCQYFIDKETDVSIPIVPVGYPVEDKEIFLLDENGEEVARNQVGEIAVKSRYLSSEYWRNSELTNAKFFPDPDGGHKSIYLTGDLGRMVPDGCLIYLGRKDLEVKIRGCKVAILEIEMALLAHPQVRDAAVAAWNDASGEKYLVAYLVPHEGPPPKSSELYDFFKTKLPDYMIPSTFVFLDSLPQTNGKVDRRSLPRPERVRPELEQPCVPPRTEIDRRLKAIWEEVLDIHSIGIYDNFFDLGGHSLAATRVVSQVIKTFQLELSLPALFRAPTIAEMAAVITEHQGRKIGAEELDRILTELESLSEDEAERSLSGQSGTTNTRGSTNG